MLMLRVRLEVTVTSKLGDEALPALAWLRVRVRVRVRLRSLGLSECAP